MKNFFKVLGIAALVTAIGFGVFSCGGDPSTPVNTIGELAGSWRTNLSVTVSAGDILDLVAEEDDDIADFLSELSDVKALFEDLLGITFTDFDAFLTGLEDEEDFEILLTIIEELEIDSFDDFQEIIDGLLNMNVTVNTGFTITIDTNEGTADYTINSFSINFSGDVGKLYVQLIEMAIEAAGSEIPQGVKDLININTYAGTISLSSSTTLGALVTAMGGGQLPAEMTSIDPSMDISFLGLVRKGNTVTFDMNNLFDMLDPEEAAQVLAVFDLLGLSSTINFTKI